VLKREKAAGPAGAALDLVHQEQEIPVVAQLAQPDQEFRGAGVYAPVPLDRLDEDRRRVVVHVARKAANIVELAEDEAGHQRPEPLLHGLLRGRAHPAEHPAVKSVLGADHPDALALHAGLAHAVEPRELDHRLVGLAAAVAEKDAARAGVSDQPARELGLVGVPEQVARVVELRGLALDLRDPVRVAMAEGAHRYPGGEVEVGVSLVVPDGRAAPAHERDRRPRVVLEDVRVVQVGGARPDNGLRVSH
jgi:hypothetical protein